MARVIEMARVAEVLCDETGKRPGPTPEVRGSRTSRHSAHAQSQV